MWRRIENRCSSREVSISSPRKCRSMNERIDTLTGEHTNRIHSVSLVGIDVSIVERRIEIHRATNGNNRVDESRYYNQCRIDRHRKNLEYNSRTWTDRIQVEMVGERWEYESIGRREAVPSSEDKESTSKWAETRVDGRLGRSTWRRHASQARSIQIIQEESRHYHYERSPSRENENENERRRGKRKAKEKYDRTCFSLSLLVFSLPPSLSCCWKCPARAIRDDNDDDKCMTNGDCYPLSSSTLMWRFLPSQRRENEDNSRFRCVRESVIGHFRVFCCPEEFLARNSLNKSEREKMISHKTCMTMTWLV